MSKIEVDKVDPQSGTALEIGTSGDTVTVPSGVGLTLTDSTLLLPTTIKTDKLDPKSGTALEIGTSGDTITVPTGAGLTVTDEVKTNKISPATGTAFALGDSGDTFTVPSGATIVNSGTATGFGGGKIGQVVVTTKTDTASVASATFADMSGMTVAITPVATSSRILIMGTAIMQNHVQYSYFRFVRDIGGAGDTVPTGFVGDAAGSRIRTTGAQLYSYFANDNISFPHSWHLVDSPSTTSACTYKMQCRNSAATTTIYLNRSPYDGDSATGHRSTSTLIAMEILV